MRYDKRAAERALVSNLKLVAQRFTITDSCIQLKHIYIVDSFFIVIICSVFVSHLDYICVSLVNFIERATSSNISVFSSSDMNNS